MNYVYAVLVLAAATAVCSGAAWLVGRIIDRRDTQVPTDVPARAHYCEIGLSAAERLRAAGLLTEPERNAS